jgi:large subunit ribosomal protein L25
MALLYVMRQGAELPSQPMDSHRQGLVSVLLVDKENTSHRMVASFHEIRRAIKEAEGVGKFKLRVDGDKRTRSVIVKSVERDASERTRFRLVLAEIGEADTLRIDVPVTFHGSPSELPKDTVIDRPCKYVRVRGKVSLLPDKFDVDLSKLDAGKPICAGSLNLPEGIELLTPEETKLFALKKVSSDAPPSRT